MGHVGAAAHDLAVGRIYQVFRVQAAVLAYSDVFMICAAAAFAVVPLTLLFSAAKASAGGPAH